MNTWLESILRHLDEQAMGKGDPYACIELVNLYRYCQPLSAFAYGLKAVRLGLEMELGPLQSAVENLRSSECTAIGCYRLGSELASYPREAADTRKAVSYLKAAANAEDAPCCGAAALCLADLLSSIGESRAECYRYYAIAEAKGFCDILPPEHRTRQEKTLTV